MRIENAWDTTVKTPEALEQAMEALGHKNIVWDHVRGYFRGTCQHGCTGILMAGRHAYGTGLYRCPAAPAEERAAA